MLALAAHVVLLALEGSGRHMSRWRPWCRGDSLSALGWGHRQPRMSGHRMFEELRDPRIVGAGALVLAVALAFAWPGIEGDPKPEGTANSRGHILAGDGKFDEAIASYSKAIQLEPSGTGPIKAAALRIGRMARARARDCRLFARDRDQRQFRGGLLSARRDVQARQEFQSRSDRSRGGHPPRSDGGAAVLCARADPPSAGRIRRGHDGFRCGYQIRGDKADWLHRARPPCHFDLDRPAQAAEDFAAAMREAFGYRDSIALLEYPKQSPPMMDYLHPFDPDGYYLLLWTHFARMRAGHDDREEMAEHARKLASPISRKLAGKAGGDKER